MALKGFKAVQNLSKEELTSQVRDVKKKIFDLRLQKKTGQLENPRSIWAERKKLARMKMLLTSLERKPADGQQK